MREAYRLQKQNHLYNLLTGNDKKIMLSVAYIGKEIISYDIIEKKMQKLLTQIGGCVLQ